jgi:hypothetical protein
LSIIELSSRVALAIGVVVLGWLFITRLFPRAMDVAYSHLPTETQERELELPAGIEAVLGWLLPSDVAAGAAADLRGGIIPSVQFTTHVRSGILGLNPAQVAFELLSLAPDRTHVRLQAQAREGLIKQHSAARAVAAISDQLIARARGGQSG